MSNILVRPPALRQISEQLKSSAKKIDSAMQGIDSDILSLKSDKFVGNRADTLQSKYSPKRDALINAKEIVLRFAVELQAIASAFENADRGQFAQLPFSGGIGGLLPLIEPWWISQNIIQPLGKLNIPGWLKSELYKIFAPSNTTSPISNAKSIPQAESGFGKLLKQTPSVSSTPASDMSTTKTLDVSNSKPDSQNFASGSASPSLATNHNLDVSYNVPVQSQGTLYGSAACSPTSISMVLAYYNAKDSSNKIASAQDIINMSDKGDGTYGKGMALSSLTDELNTLGYKNINTQINAQYSDLQTALKDGPVIVTTGVKLVGDGIVNSSGPRALEGPGNILHAIVVTGAGNDNVVINDPWSGTQMELSKDTFEKMWTRGSGGMYSIRP